MSRSIVRPAARTPAVLAQEIAREHDAAQDSFRAAVEHAIRCGSLLIEAKAQVGHGGWGEWIDERFPASRRTAQGYMRLARSENAQALAHLGIEGALKQLAAPKENDPAEQMAADMAAAIVSYCRDGEIRGEDVGLPEGVVFRPTGLDLPDDLSFEDWRRVGSFISALDPESRQTLRGPEAGS